MLAWFFSDPRVCCKAENAVSSFHFNHILTSDFCKKYFQNDRMILLINMQFLCKTVDNTFLMHFILLHFFFTFSNQVPYNLLIFFWGGGRFYDVSQMLM